MTDWESMWGRGIGRGQAFDAAKPETALLALIPGSGVTGLETPQLDLSGKVAFVPGCGRGYSVAALVTGGCSRVDGLELSSTAAQAARDYLSMETEVGSAAVVSEGDFFSHEPPSAYDLVYDCTFLCAIPPGRRREWADKMAHLVRPGGELITLIFPFRDDAADPADGEVGGGPPYAMSPRLVEDLVLPAGFTKISLERVPDDLVTRPMAGEWVARWARSDQGNEL